jgi:hypothetical protein
VIAHVIGGYGLPHNVFRQFTRAEQARLLAQLGAASNSILNAARERACGIGVATILLESRSGDVAEAIVDIALAKKSGTYRR